MENMPLKIPPRMMTGRNRAGRALRVAWPFSFQVDLP